MNPKALQTITYGLYVVAARKGERLNGQIANAVIQITSQPPAIAVSLNKNNLTHEFIKESKAFSISVLCRDTPLAFIGRFGFKSGRDIDKLAGTNYIIGKTQAPLVLENAVAYLEAKVTQEIDVGTHTLFIGELVDADVITEKECLTYDYYQRIKRGTTPQTAPAYREEKRVEVPRAPKYQCNVCGYVYDPERGDPDSGIKPGIPFAELPEEWVCPVCGASKSSFERIE